jgi:stearoyl-CoA desaturase (delta-9 desaturase)
MGLIVPAVISGLGWNDWAGGLVYAGVLRIFIVQQSTFCVNSLAHHLGDQPFDYRNTSRDNFIVALITLGEGYHNFHHQFPSDYRNTIDWLKFDPTKWSIIIWNMFGLASHLKTFSQNEIQMSRMQQLQKKLNRLCSTVDWGIPLYELPVLKWKDYVAQTKNGKALVVIAGVIHDVAHFMKDHPGEQALLSRYIGKDATAAFNGGIYDHSSAVHNVLAMMRVGVIDGGGEVEGSLKNEDIRAGQYVTRVIQDL